MQLSPLYMPEGHTRTLRNITIVCHLVPRLKPELRITKTHNVQIAQRIRPVHRQRNIIHKRTIGTSPVTQHILPIATADLSMHTRNRTMLDQSDTPRCRPIVKTSPSLPAPIRASRTSTLTLACGTGTRYAIPDSPG